MNSPDEPMSVVWKTEDVVRLADMGHVQALRKAIEEGANIHAKDDRGLSPLHWACMQGHVEVVELLLEHHANIHNQDDDRIWTPLQWASRNGHIHIVKRLIAQGADLSCVTQAMLDTLRWQGHTQVAELLEQALLNQQVAKERQHLLDAVADVLLPNVKHGAVVQEQTPRLRKKL